MASPEYWVGVELMEIHGFSEKYSDLTSKTLKSTKESGKPKDGKGGKDTQDGKGKDHQSPLPSHSFPIQVPLSSVEYYRMPVGWRAQAT